ncbi:MAG TPA: AI-2E family transporter, partial [Methylophilaceae bacterium]|nr:AI-2E family transporter [Methylophilaceae bacterium]
MNGSSKSKAAEPISNPVLEPDTADIASEPLPTIGEPAGAPVEARGLAIGVLATIAFIYALDWAEAFFISILLGILLAYTLNPLVIALERIKIPRFIGVPLVVFSVICGITYGGYSLRGQVDSIIAQLPEA